jgi:hypothetical protein
LRSLQEGCMVNLDPQSHPSTRHQAQQQPHPVP